MVVVACTTFGAAPSDDGGVDPTAEAGAPADASLVEASPAFDAGHANSFCDRKPANTVLCADFEPGSAGLSAFDGELRPGDVALRRVVQDETQNFALEVTGDASSGPRVRKVLPPMAAYRLAFRVQIRATEKCDFMALGGFFSTYGEKEEGGYLYGAALYAPSYPFSLSGRRYSATGVLENLQTGSRWYDISVEVGPPAALNRRPAVVRIDGVEAPEQTTDDSGDAARNVLAIDIGRIYPSNCGLATLRFDDVLVVRR